MEVLESSSTITESSLEGEEETEDDWEGVAFSSTEFSSRDRCVPVLWLREAELGSPTLLGDVVGEFTVGVDEVCDLVRFVKVFSVADFELAPARG